MSYFTRSEWGAEPPHSFVVMDPSSVETIFVHWNGVHTSSFGAALMRAIQRYHKANGYADFAYSFGTDIKGDRFEGRGYYRQDGATSPAEAGRSYSIFCGIGPGQKTPRRMLRAIKLQVQDCREARGKNIPVKPHRDAYETQCPGDYLTEWIRRGMPIEGDGDRPVRPDQDLVRPKLPDLPAKVVLFQRDWRNAFPWRKRRIHAMQRALSFLGYGIVGTGPWGPTTERALRQFQKAHNIPAPPVRQKGVSTAVSQGTWSALRKAVAREGSK